MQEYGVIRTDFWLNPNYSFMSPNARCIAVYLMSCPHKILWKKHSLPEQFICSDLSLDKQTVRCAIKELIDAKHLRAELKNGLLFIDPLMFRKVS